MICYKDKTFCPFHKKCKHGTDCDRALTDEIIADAVRWKMAISQYMQEPECYAEVESGS